jgi:hypothetical protein
LYNEKLSPFAAVFFLCVPYLKIIFRKLLLPVYGRPANEPELLFRLYFIQILYNLSNEHVIQDPQVNLAPEPLLFHLRGGIFYYFCLSNLTPLEDIASFCRTFFNIEIIREKIALD